jgi:hypothetical protein
VFVLRTIHTFTSTIFHTTILHSSISIHRSIEQFYPKQPQHVDGNSSTQAQAPTHAHKRSLPTTPTSETKIIQVRHLLWGNPLTPSTGNSSAQAQAQAPTHIRTIYLQCSLDKFSSDTLLLSFTTILHSSISMNRAILLPIVAHKHQHIHTYTHKRFPTPTSTNQIRRLLRGIPCRVASIVIRRAPRPRTQLGPPLPFRLPSQQRSTYHCRTRGEC